VSRRSERARARERSGRGQGAGEAAPGAERDGPGTRGDRRSTWGLGAQLLFPVAVFAVVTAVAELAGAANLGVALGIGQIAFAIAVIYVLLRR
jgi:hypothetical protein